MTFEQEIDNFWRAFSSGQRQWMEKHHKSYQEAVRTQNAVKAQEIVCALFAGSRRAQFARLKRLGVYVFGFDGKHAVPIGEPKPEVARST